MFLLLFVCSNILAQNCEVKGPIVINPQGVTEITFDVSGLLNNDLSTAQGLCLVELGFTHNSVSQLEVEIESPSGQTVQLIGAGNVTSLGSTQYISWDVTFAASNYPALPDGTFGDNWDNSNPWQAFTNYSGRYYPYQGNLEDMDMGPANGLWTLRITDLGQFGSGVLDIASIQFCEAANQTCNVCYAEAGFFDAVPSQVFCANDPVLSNENYFRVLTEGASFNNPDYNYAVVEGGDIISFDNNLDLSTLPVGSYQLCGVINREEDQDAILTISTIADLEAVFNDGTYCGDVMNGCLDIRIEEPQSMETKTETICPGEVIALDGINFYQTVDTTIYTYTGGGCEAATRYIVTQTDVEALIIASTNTIDCNGTLILNGQNSEGTGLSYSWTTESGNFVNNSGPIATVNEPGLYFLEVTSGACSDMFSYEVLPGNNFSNTIELQADSLGCANSLVTIETSIDGSYDDFSWEGPGITDPNELNPTVDEPGVYTLTVNNSSASCQSVSNSIVIVQSNSAQTPVFNSIAPLDCNEFATLQVVNQIDVADAAWLSSNGDTISQNPIALNIPGPGTYTFSYIDGFGCAGSASTTVEANYDALEYTVTIDSLSCGVFEGQIFVEVENGLVDSYFWNGPDNQFYFDPNPEIRLPGNYQLTMTGADGCITKDTIIVEYDEEAFNHTVAVPEITCSERETDIFVIPAPAGYQYEWERKNDASFMAPNASVISVDQGGIYYVTITRPSDGCQTQEWTFVNTDTLPADLTFDLEKIDCDTDRILLESNANGFGLMNFTWSGPGINPSNETEVFPEVDMIGEYVIEGISSNGCEFQDTVIVEEDFTPINLSPQPVFVLDCFDTDAATLVQADREGEFTWLTPGGFMGGPVTDTRIGLDILEVGNYTIDVVGSNGCSDQLIIEVEYGQAPPEVDILGSSTLDCVNPEIDLEVILSGDWDSYTWLSHPILTDQNVTVTEPGEYIVEVRNNAGCFSSDTLMIEDNRREIELSLLADTITCIDLEAEILVETMEPSIGYQWSGPTGDLGNDETIFVDQVDTYYVTITGQDGCIGIDSISIESDTSTLAFDLLPIAAIDCIDDVAVGVIDPGSVDYDQISTVNWILDGNIEAEGTSGNLTMGGMYTVELIAANGCASETMVEVFENKIYPEVSIEPDSINCENTLFEVEAIVIVGDNLSFQWDGPDPDVQGLTDANISGEEAGIYTVTITDENNCSIIETIEINGDFEEPTTFAEDLLISCDLPSANIILQNFDDAIHTIEVLDPNGTSLADVMDEITIPGEYTLLTTGENGCVGETVFQVTGELLPPSATIDSTNINCTNTEGTICIQSNDDIRTYEWFNNGSSITDDSDCITTSDAGMFEVVITGENGCSDTLRSMIEIDTISPIIALQQVGIIGCESQEAVISAADTQGNVLSYNWSTDDGEIINGQEQIDVTVGGVGTYDLTVVDQVNGCESNQSMTIEDQSVTLENLVVDFMSPTCEGQAAGQINISSVEGGYAPLTYSIDGGQTFSNESLFEDLQSAEYDILVKDSIGCSISDVVVLDDGNSILLDLGQDTTIALGQSLTISPSSNYDPSDLTLEWETNYPDYECDGCWETEVSPLQTTIYTLTITDPFNCTASDRIIVQVSDTVQVYIPNILDTESVNEDAMVHFYAGPGVQSVNSWMILDRWGNVMHQRNNFEPNDPQTAWDGTSNGVKVVPGVYLFVTEVVLINGDIRTKVGDITVIR